MLIKKFTFTKLTFSALLVWGFGSVQAELTPQQQEALNQYNHMHSLPQAERREFRRTLFADMTSEQRDAFKAAVDFALGQQTNRNTVKKHSTNNNRRVPGTNITYDDGIITNFNPGSDSMMIGNRFNTGFDGTAIENVESSGTITQVTVDMVTVGGGAAFFSVFDNIAGTAANLVTSVSIPLTAGLNTFALSGGPGDVMYTGGEFLAGIWKFGAASDIPGAGSGTVNGLGFHGVSINDIVGTGFTDLVSAMALNAMVRVSGNVLEDNVPVELIDFNIEETD